jgi:hypothetical protein
MNVAKSGHLTSHRERLCKRTKSNISDFLASFFMLELIFFLFLFLGVFEWTALLRIVLFFPEILVQIWSIPDKL